MMTQRSLALLGFLCAPQVARVSVWAQSRGTPVVIGETIQLQSNTLKESRSLLISKPAGYDSGMERYPVLYLLDAETHFHYASGLADFLAKDDRMPNMLFVGIVSGDMARRTHDLTPPSTAETDNRFSPGNGGADAFLSFFADELIPFVDKTYRTRPYRLLIGHSFGGLTVMNIITNHTKLFNAYIAIDPSMWYDKGQFLKASEKKLSAQKYNEVSLYLGIANTMPEGMTLEKMKKDTSVDTRHIRSIFAMDKFIRDNPPNGLKYASKYYADDDHGSVPLTSEYDGLRFIFSWYRFKFSRADFMDSGTALIQKMQRHYQEASQQFGYKVSPPEMQINALGYNALSLKQYAKAAALFEMNIANYPNSGNVYDSYADLLVAEKDTMKAIVNYQKAFAMTKSDDTKQKLDQLQGRSTFAVTSEDLKKYVGAFEFEAISLTATTSIKENALWVSAPGQGDFELVPL